MAQSKTSTSFLLEKSEYLREHSSALMREAEDLCRASHQLRNTMSMRARRAGLMTSRAVCSTPLDSTRVSRFSGRLNSVEIDAGSAGSDVDDCDYFQLAEIDYLDSSCF